MFSLVAKAVCGPGVPNIGERNEVAIGTKLGQWRRRSGEEGISERLVPEPVIRLDAVVCAVDAAAASAR